MCIYIYIYICIYICINIYIGHIATLNTNYTQADSKTILSEYDKALYVPFKKSSYPLNIHYVLHRALS